MRINSLEEANKTKILYLGVFLLLCVVSFYLLSTPIQMIFHETDFWWMIPTLSNISQHNSFWETVKIHFFNSDPKNHGEPTMNLYLFLIYYFLGFKAQYFIFISAILHLCCAFFLYRILKRIGFSLQSAFLTVLIYTFSFFHSFYFLWPMSAHHLTVMFFTLLTFSLFLETNYRLDHALPWKAVFWQTLIVNFLASFFPIQILMLPVSIFVYLLCCSEDRLKKSKRYSLWMPLFITFLAVRLIRSPVWEYPASYQKWYFIIFKKILAHLPFLEKLTLNVNLEMNPIILYLLLFITGLACLFLIRYLLKITLKPAFFIFLKKAILTCIIFYLFLFLFARGHKNILVPIGVGIPLPDFISPYNFIRPLVAIFIDFLNPISTVLSMNAAIPYFYIPVRSDIVWTVLFLFLLFIFLRKVYFQHKPLIFFVIIYILGLPLLTQISLWEMKNSVPSRYFVYITPLFAVIFSSSFSLIYNFFMNKVKISVFKKELILIIFFSTACLLNIVAIKLILVKDKFVNEFVIYDYIKGANLIKQDLEHFKNTIHLEDICVAGVLPMPFYEYGWDFSPANPQDLDTFKYTLAQVLNDRSALSVCINSLKDMNKKKELYIFDKTGVINQSGKTIDPFLISFYGAKKELELKNYKQAHILFEEAVQVRPFLFRYILSNRSLEDILWMANGRSAYTLVSDISNHYNSWVNSPVDKVDYITKMLDREMKDYIECFFYLSYLSYIEKNLSESYYWYSRIRFINDQNDGVLSSLNKQAMIKSDSGMQKYVNEIENNSLYAKKEDAVFSSMDIIFKLFSNNRS